VFVDLKTGDRQPLSDAVEAGLVTAEYDNGQEANGDGQTDTKTYAVHSVVDQVRLTPLTTRGFGVRINPIRRTCLPSI